MPIQGSRLLLFKNLKSKTNQLKLLGVYLYANVVNISKIIYSLKLMFFIFVLLLPGSYNLPWICYTFKENLWKSQENLHFLAILNHLQGKIRQNKYNSWRISRVFSNTLIYHRREQHLKSNIRPKTRQTPSTSSDYFPFSKYRELILLDTRFTIIIPKIRWRSWRLYRKAPTKCFEGNYINYLVLS